MMTARLMTLTVAMALTAWLGAAEIALPPAEKTGGMPLAEALAARKSVRNTVGEKPTAQQLADLLWAGNGVTRANGKRTAPSAMNRQEIEQAVLTADGLFTYDAKQHSLTKVETTVDVESLRRGASAMVVLYYKEGTQTREAALMDVGFVAQNLSLQAASKGWVGFVNGSLDRVKLSEALGLKESEILLGYRLGIR